MSFKNGRSFIGTVIALLNLSPQSATSKAG
jgi:hypothetical protein